jgi:hypothetical protein
MDNLETLFTLGTKTQYEDKQNTLFLVGFMLLNF